MEDDWKGERLIRKSITEKESRSEVRRLVSTIAHQNRRAQGMEHPAAKAHGRFMLAALIDLTKGKQ